MNSAEAFQRSQDELMDAPERLVDQSISDNLKITAEQLLQEIKAANSTKEMRLSSLKKFGLYCMAEAAKEHSVDNPLLGNYAWMDIAQHELATISESPEDLPILLSTELFDTSAAFRRGLNRMISSSIEPAGAYEDKAFRNGVASDRIH